MRILVLEPYYGGSHKTFLDGLQAHLPDDFILLTLPARKWKWRMRLAAPYFAEKVASLVLDKPIDVIFCSSFVDVAVLRSLLPASMGQRPIHTYFHENQFAYPVRKEDERDLHFGLTNLTSILASDRAAFNSSHNLHTFLAGAAQLLKKCPDMKLAGVWQEIEVRTSVLPLGINFSHIDRAAKIQGKNSPVPVIVWNHRWEHDKNPKYFFETLFQLDVAGMDFRLIVLGQSFRRQPGIFAEARRRLRSKVLHFGFAESRQDYARLLAMGDIVVSTAKHEFYGISVLEAVRAGCRPLLPNRLSYPELFPADFLYEEKELYCRLRALLQYPAGIDEAAVKAITNRFSWPVLAKRYLAWFGDAQTSYPG